jgi:hypothetical protein
MDGVMNKVISFLQYIPVLGLFVREAVRGSDATKINFLLNVLMGWILAIYFIGYPAIIVPALVMAPTMIFILVSITMRDIMRQT